MTPAHQKAMHEGAERYRLEQRRAGIALASHEVMFIKLTREIDVLKVSIESDQDEIRLANLKADRKTVLEFINGRKATAADYENAYDDGEIKRPFTS